MAEKPITVEFRGTLRPLYQELLDNPPSGVKYRLYDPRNALLARRLVDRTGIPGRIARRAYWRLRYGDVFSPPLLHLSNYWDYSPIRMRRKFVADTENVGTFVADWKFHDLASPSIRKKIEESIRSRYCRKIMPLTQAAERTMKAVLDLHGVEKKLEVVYPATRPLPSSLEKNVERVTILFVGHNFTIKGGRELLDAFRSIRFRYNVKLVIISEEAYRTISPEEKVEIYPSQPRGKIISDFFPQADIFCMPTYSDSFGFVFLEAKAFGLPIVSTTHFHLPEIVEDGKSGFLIETPVSCWNTDYTYNHLWLQTLEKGEFSSFVTELGEKLSTLIEDSRLRREMGEAGKREVLDGRFSLEKRNNKLRMIYVDAECS